MLQVEARFKPLDLDATVGITVPVEHLLNSKLLNAVDLSFHLLNLKRNNGVRGAKELVLSGSVFAHAETSGTGNRRGAMLDTKGEGERETETEERDRERERE